MLTQNLLGVVLATVTISVPDELKEKMSLFPEMNWSAVARKAIVERVKFIEKMDKQLSGSRLSKKDTIALGRKVKHSVSKKFAQR